MSHPQYPNPQYPNAPYKAPVPQKPKSPWPWIISGAVVLMFLIGFVASVSGGGSDPSSAASTSSAAPDTVYRTVTADPPAPTTSDRTPTTASSDLTYPEKKFIEYLRDKGVNIPSTVEEKFVELGRTACRALDAGNTVEALYKVTIDKGRLSSDDAAAFLGASIGMFCPQHMNKLPS